MLQNPNFEDGWHEQGAGELVLPDYWAVEYLDGGDPWFRPEIKPNEEYTTSGRYSVRAFPPAHSRGFFGIWQQIEVEAGAWYQFTADVRVESNPPGEMAAFVGIQPWGAGIFERQMLWGKETQQTGTWKRVEIIAPAYGNRIRVVLGATNKWATQNNTVWWDNCALAPWVWDGGGEPDPEPEPDGCQFSKEALRQVIRAELDRTVLGSKAG